MNTTNSVNRDIQTIQKDVISLLKELDLLLSGLAQKRVSEATNEKIKRVRNDIQNEIVKVKALELRMAVVAPMSAGKSTIINAIIGQKLLPSRNTAMTTLPTEVIFEHDCKESKLVIPKQISTVLKKSVGIVHKQIAMRKKSIRNPQLSELVTKVLNFLTS